ncbi:MAG: FAD-dependent oxidoreductase [Parcubacteria group bacterium]|nr:FAD-dependent oxidoreductase [Parcubacteria group bacterium]
MVYDLIIIGGGPAGITAGIYSARKAIKVLFLTKDFVGQIGKTAEVGNWPGSSDILGLDLIKNFEKHLREHKIDIKEGIDIVGVKKDGKDFVVTTQEQEFFAKAVIVATGRTPRKLNVKGEKEFLNRGVSYCVICDGPLFKGKQVAVIGGGNAGFEAALELSTYTKKVFIIEMQDSVSADEILQKRGEQADNIEVIVNTKVESIEGKNMVEKLICQDTVANKEISLDIDGVFIEIGSVSVVGYLKGVVELNETGEVKVNPETCETSVKGLFAAGDMNDKKWKQIITASADGARSALAVYEYLNF